MIKEFWKYIKGRRDILLIASVAALGLILIVLGGADKQEETPLGIEKSIAEACSRIEGVGECYAYVYYSGDDVSEGEVESVIVVCEGADSVEVRYKLTEIITSFLGIGANRVRVEKMSD